jgi:hypothetical protein
MSDRTAEFNFYQMWLGIECRSRPDHYQLLGVALFETNEQKILAAFDARRKQLQGISPGEFSAQWRKLADEVISAKRCLMTPAARMVYDEHLRYTTHQNGSKLAADAELTLADELSPPSNGATTKSAGSSKVDRAGPSIDLPPIDSADEAILGDLPELPPAAGDAQSFIPAAHALAGDAGLASLSVEPHSVGAAMSEKAIRPHLTIPGSTASPKSSAALAKLERDRRQRQRNFIILSTIVAVCFISGLILLSQLPERTKLDEKKLVGKAPTVDSGQAGSTRSPIPKDAAPVDSMPMTEQSPSEPPSGKSPIEPSRDSPMPAEPMPVKPSARDLPTPDPEQEKAFHVVLKSVRDVLAVRKLEEASTIVAAAEQVAVGDEQKRQVELYQQLVRHTADFWEAVSRGAARLQGGDELERDGKPFAIVVETRAGKLIIKADGRNHTYTIPGDVDAAVAVAILEKMNAGMAEKNRLLGAFYAADANGNLSKAELLWSDAGEGLQPLVKLLKAEQSKDDRK